MLSLDRWDVALLAFVGYLAVTTLVRLMGRNRDQLIGQLEQEAEAERQRQAIEAKKQARAEQKRRRAA